MLNMNSKEIVSCLKQVASFLEIVPGKLSFNALGLCTLSKNQRSIKGVFNIINEFLTESRSALGDGTLEEKILIRQWLEYSIVYAASAEGNSSIFETLNEVFMRKTYLLGTRLSIADIVLYYIIQANMEHLTYLEKEKYINVCRWFDNIQQNPLIRQSNPLVDFNTIHLANGIPVRH